jgi:hypothetical protein
MRLNRLHFSAFAAQRAGRLAAALWLLIALCASESALAHHPVDSRTLFHRAAAAQPESALPATPVPATPLVELRSHCPGLPGQECCATPSWMLPASGSDAALVDASWGYARVDDQRLAFEIATLPAPRVGSPFRGAHGARAPPLTTNG